MSAMGYSGGYRKYLREILVCELAQLIMEMGLLLLEIIETFLALLKLVAHFDLDGTRLVDLGHLLVEFLLDDLELFLARLKCLGMALVFFTCRIRTSTHILRFFSLLSDARYITLLSCHVLFHFLSFNCELL